MSDERPEQITTTEARAGATPQETRYVLVFGLLLVVAAFALIGRLFRDRIDRRILLAAFTSGWLLFYGWFWLTHPG